MDKALVHQLEIATAMHGIRGKKGKLPKMSSIPNIRVWHDDSGPNWHFNMDPHPTVSSAGETVHPYKPNSQAINPKFRRHGKLASITFQQEIGRSPKFNRALTKIAFSSLTYFCGAELVLDNQYDHIRRYVNHGGVRRPVILSENNEEYYTRVASPLSSDGVFHSVPVTLATLAFLIDLSPDLHMFHSLKHMLESRGDSGWCTIPSNYSI